MNPPREVLLPDIGDFHDVPVIEILVKQGDAIAVDDPLIVLESDKATMEIPSPAAGIVRELKVAVGSKLNQGSLILTLESDAAPGQHREQPTAQEPPPAPTAMAVPPAADSAAVATVAQKPAEVIKPSPTAAVDSDPIGGPTHASPSVRRHARELGVDLARVQGSGAKGRILKEDVHSFVKTALSKPPQAGLNLTPWPEVNYPKFGPVERRPLSRLRKISGANLARNWVMIPHVTSFDEADITDLDAFRMDLNRESEASDTKITILAFIIKAAVAALEKFPEFNASLDGEDLVLKHYYHIGFAADTPHGLVVPVIKEADRKGIQQIAAEAAQLAAQAREGRLKPGEMQGGCFSISSLGGIGGTSFTPIINAPEVAILGVTKAQWKQVWDGEQFRPRLMLPLCLSFDHRVVDGAAAARFLVYFASLLADFRRVLL